MACHAVDGAYGVSVFVMEENGLPLKRVATKPNKIKVENSK